MQISSFSYPYYFSSMFERVLEKLKIKRARESELPAELVAQVLQSFAKICPY